MRSLQVSIAALPALLCFGCGDGNPVIGKWELIDKQTAFFCPSTLEVSDKVWRTNDAATPYTYTKDSISHLFTFPNGHTMVVYLEADKNITLEAGMFKCKLRRV